MQELVYRTLSTHFLTMQIFPVSVFFRKRPSCPAAPEASALDAASVMLLSGNAARSRQEITSALTKFLKTNCQVPVLNTIMDIVFDISKER